MDEIQTVVDGVGARLRAVRKRRGVTLAQLSAETGISVSTLSRLESGGRRPTLELLIRLAQAHRLALDELVGAPITGDPRIHTRPIRRGGVTWVRLSMKGAALQAFKQVIPIATTPTRVSEPCRHEGYEWVYVLHGQLALTLGEHTQLLVDGQTAEFDSQVPHGYANVGDSALELLLIVGEHGARVHLPAREDIDLQTPAGDL